MNVFNYYPQLVSTYFPKFMNKIIEGNTFELLHQFPDNFLFSTITSPPYWLARYYKTKPQIFGGNPTCNHKWVAFLRKGISGGVSNKTMLKRKGTDNFQIVDDMEQGFCLSCSAWRGEFGREPYLKDHTFIIEGKPLIFKGYLSHLCDLAELILKKTRLDGSLWVNLGDKYHDKGALNYPLDANPFYIEDTQVDKVQDLLLQSNEFSSKSLCGVPQRFMIEMIDRGYIVRNNIIWKKDNAFPSPITDRFTVNFEDIFFITKNNRTLYWVNQQTMEMITKLPKGIQGEEGIDWYWDICKDCLDEIMETPKIMNTFLQTVHEKFWFINDYDVFYETITSLSKETLSQISFTSVCNSERCCNGKIKRSYWESYDYYFDQQFEPLKSPIKKSKYAPNKSKEIGLVNGTYSGNSYDAKNYQHGKNKRAVWEINTKANNALHYATYNEELIRIPIQSGIPQYFCKICGLPRIKVYEFTKTDPLEIYNGHAKKDYEQALAQNPSNAKRHILESMRRLRNFKGYSHCQCEHPQYVFGFGYDPFMGTGTTAKVLSKNNLEYVGHELKDDYVTIANESLSPLHKNKKLDQFFNIVK